MYIFPRNKITRKNKLSCDSDFYHYVDRRRFLFIYFLNVIYSKQNYNII